MGLTPELESLSAAEKLQIAAALWSRIASAPESLKLPPQVHDEHRDRLARMIDDPETTMDRSEMWRRVDASR